jgi:hypothetical protein
LAAHGLRSWRRGFLVPWLMYYLMILGILVMYLARLFYFHALNLKQVRPETWKTNIGIKVLKSPFA